MDKDTLAISEATGGPERVGKKLKLKYKYGGDGLIAIPLDNGEEVQFGAPWCGYFEDLYGAKIITPPEDGMEFNLKERDFR